MTKPTCPVCNSEMLTQGVSQDILCMQCRTTLVIIPKKEYLQYTMATKHG